MMPYTVAGEATMRSVAPTAAGERLAQAIGHRFDEIEAELDALTALRDKPAGTVRITCGDNVLRTVLLPKLTPLLRDYPDITFEFDMSYGFRDIVAERFDAGVRLGKTIDKDMIAVPIGPSLRMAVVASPSYFERQPKPKTPQDLTAHRCSNQRMPTSGGLYVWDFARRGKRVNVRVDGPLIFNTAPPQVEHWIAHVRTVARLHASELSHHDDQTARCRRLVELNVTEQLYNLSRLPSVQAAHAAGRPLELHGWVYGIHDGLLRDLAVTERLRKTA